MKTGNIMKNNNIEYITTSSQLDNNEKNILINNMDINYGSNLYSTETILFENTDGIGSVGTETIAGIVVDLNDDIRNFDSLIFHTRTDWSGLRGNDFIVSAQTIQDIIEFNMYPSGRIFMMLCMGRNDLNEYMIIDNSKTDIDITCTYTSLICNFSRTRLFKIVGVKFKSLPSNIDYEDIPIDELELLAGNNLSIDGITNSLLIKSTNGCGTFKITTGDNPIITLPSDCYWEANEIPILDSNTIYVIQYRLGIFSILNKLVIT